MTIQGYAILKMIRKAAWKSSEIAAVVKYDRKVIHPEGFNTPSISYQKYFPEITSILNMLVNEKYIERISKERPVFILTQKGLHFFQQRSAAAIASIISLIVSGIVSTVISLVVRNMQ